MKILIAAGEDTGHGGRPRLIVSTNRNMSKDYLKIESSFW